MIPIGTRGSESNLENTAPPPIGLGVNGLSRWVEGVRDVIKAFTIPSPTLVVEATWARQVIQLPTQPPTTSA